jgi:hypothetical protein
VVVANAVTAESIQTALSGSTYILSDATRGLEFKLITQLEQLLSTTNFTDVDNNWTAAEFNNTNKDNGALDAHWG